MAKRKFQKIRKSKEENSIVRKPNQRVSRKTKRKQAKLIKKARREFNCRKLTFLEPEENESQLKAENAEFSDDDKEMEEYQTEIMNERETDERTQAEQRKKRMLEDNEQEDRNIHQLEKQLKINKRKNKTRPFVSDGLDYLLELCDPESIAGLREPDLSDNSIDFDEDFAVVMGEKQPKKKVENSQPKSSGVGTKRVHFEEPVSSSCQEAAERQIKSLETDRGLSDVPDDMDEGVAEDSSCSDALKSTKDSSEGVTRSNEQRKERKRRKKKKTTLKEDIYGRIRDDEGNVVTNKSESRTKYVPPALRDKIDPENLRKTEMLLRLRRHLKGLLNRLSESNMNTICNDIEKMYLSSSRNDMNETFIELVFEAVVQTAITPERMIQEYAFLVALLHANIGSEVGAKFLESTAKKLDSFIKSGDNYGEGKECDNLVLFLIHLYSFKIVHAALIYDVLKILSDSFNEKDIDIILLVLRSAGFSLRKDDPVALKQTIGHLQMKASDNMHTNDRTRVCYMMDTLMAIRNNNMHKIPNYDTSHTEHLRKLLRNLIRKGKTVAELNVSLADLTNADFKGRWWVVGSAWKSENSPNEESCENAAVPSRRIENVSAGLLEIAQKQRINTDIRKNIFCVLMTAEDYIDAFEKLMHLGLTSQQERNIIYVVIDCCVQEATFNQFYSYLLAKFCNFNRKYQITVQFAVWDRIKELQKVSSLQLSNLTRLLSFLFLSKALSLSVLKVIQFAEMDKFIVRFLRQIMLEVLLHDPEEDCRAVFTNVSSLGKYHSLRDGLRLFMDLFLLKNKSKFSENVAVKLESRIEMVKLVLSGGEMATKL